MFKRSLQNFYINRSQSIQPLIVILRPSFIKTNFALPPGLYSVSTSPGPVGTGAGVRLSCDRHLLAAAHKNIGVGPVLATLKAILSQSYKISLSYIPLFITINQIRYHI